MISDPTLIKVALATTGAAATGVAAAASGINIDLTIVLSALIASLPATIAAIAAFKKSADTHKEINSRMTQMLAMNKTEAAATATVVEKEKQEVRQDAKDTKEAKDTKATAPVADATTGTITAKDVNVKADGNVHVTKGVSK